MQEFRDIFAHFDKEKTSNIQKKEAAIMMKVCDVDQGACSSQGREICMVSAQRKLLHVCVNLMQALGEEFNDSQLDSVCNVNGLIANRQEKWAKEQVRLSVDGR